MLSPEEVVQQADSPGNSRQPDDHYGNAATDTDVGNLARGSSPSMASLQKPDKVAQMWEMASVQIYTLIGSRSNILLCSKFTYGMQDMESEAAQ